MKASTKRWAVAIGVGLLLAVVLYLLFKVVVIAVVSAVVASAVAILVYRYLDKEPQAEVASPDVDPAAELRGLLDNLVTINIAIREEGLATDVVTRVEGIIDKLRELLPGINERHNGHELTWAVNRMAKDYLPRVVNPYIALSQTERESRRKELLNSLNGLEAEVGNVTDLVRNEKLGDFRAKAAFLRARFVEEA
jgi:hypothetical protein